MKSIPEMHKAMAEIVKTIREKSGHSCAKAAEILMIDPHTLGRWEKGQSEPAPTELLRMAATFGVDIMPLFLDFLYEDIYRDVSIAQGSEEQLREAAVNFIQHIAPVQFLREFMFMVSGVHGSNIIPQMHMFTMYNQLPLEAKTILAANLLLLYDMNHKRNALRFTDVVHPDENQFKEALNLAIASTVENRVSYTTVLDLEKDKEV